MTSDPLTASIAAAVQDARRARRLSSGELATRSGVSRAMITKIERGEVQPTAALLGRLCGTLGITLSELVARAERGDERHVRVADQPVWTDPLTGYRRRTVSPTSHAPIELIEVELPAGAEVAFPAETYTFLHQQIWILEGTLTFREGDAEYRLETGDCLQLGPPEPCVFVNPTDRTCRYLVALARRVA